MSDKAWRADAPFPVAPPDIVVHVTCPACKSPKALIAATHFGLQMCFCPTCEHAWDCKRTVTDGRAS